MKWKPLILSAFLLLALIPQTQAWKWETHQRVAQEAFDALPENIRQNLVWSAIYEGSTWPDKYKDVPDPYGRTFPDHFPPASITQAEYWLERAKESYLDGDYNNASLYLGIASHYIADSASLAHNPPHAYDWDKHEEFEQRGAGLWPAVPTLIAGFNLRQKLTEFYNAAPTVWQRWLDARAQAIVQEGVDLSASYTYNAWYEKLVGAIPSQEAQPSDVPVVAVGVAFAALAAAIAVGMKRYYRM